MADDPRPILLRQRRRLGMNEGDSVNVTQGGETVKLPAVLDAGLADGTVRIPAGVAATAKLGALFGAVSVVRA